MEKSVSTAPTDRTCQFCRFYDTVSSVQIGQAISVCRRNAPRCQGWLLGIDQQQMPRWVYTTLWPLVGSTDWCGDFARKLSS